MPIEESCRQKAKEVFGNHLPLKSCSFLIWSVLPNKDNPLVGHRRISDFAVHSSPISTIIRSIVIEMACLFGDMIRVGGNESLIDVTSAAQNKLGACWSKREEDIFFKMNIDEHKTRHQKATRQAPSLYVYQRKRDHRLLLVIMAHMLFRGYVWDCIEIASVTRDCWATAGK